MDKSKGSVRLGQDSIWPVAGKNSTAKQLVLIMGWRGQQDRPAGWSGQQAGQQAGRPAK